MIENRDHILVTLDNGTEYEAELVGTDPRQDIAVVSFDGPRGLPTARLGDSSQIVVGDLVLAVGSPFGLQSTVTSGIISALGRETSGTAGINIAEYIQTDAAINPGNSGGALVNLDGEVIGVNTWIASRSGGNVGVGFALPINAAKRAISDFLESGRVRYGYLGVFVSSASSETRESLGVDDVDGALAWSIILDSPAALGDLRPGDWITHVSGRPVRDSGELVRAVGALEPGQESTFDLVRAGAPMQVTVVVALRDDAEAWAVRDWPGIFPVPLTDRVRARFEIADNHRGMLIASVNESSATSAAGLRVGDIITHVNGTAVRDAADFYRTVGAGESGEYRFRIVRDGVRSNHRRQPVAPRATAYCLPAGEREPRRATSGRSALTTWRGTDWIAAMSVSWNRRRVSAFADESAPNWTNNWRCSLPTTSATSSCVACGARACSICPPARCGA